MSEMVSETVEVSAGTKRCRMCNETKPLEMFSPDKHNKADGHHIYCKPCRVAYNGRLRERVRPARPEPLVLRRARESATLELIRRHQEEFDALLGAGVRVEQRRPIGARVGEEVTLPAS